MASGVLILGPITYAFLRCMLKKILKRNSLGLMNDLYTSSFFVPVTYIGLELKVTEVWPSNIYKCGVLYDGWVC